MPDLPVTTMAKSERALPPTAEVLQRSVSLHEERKTETARQLDHLLAGLLLGQYVAAVATAVMYSPLVWSAEWQERNAWVAVLLGALVSMTPAALALLKPGREMTRWVLAVGQLLTCGLLLHLTHGRVEMHALVFFSLALLAFYGDLRTLLMGAAVAALDLTVRGLGWPDSYFGRGILEPGRWLEQAGWLGLETALLAYAMREANERLVILAQGQSQAEAERDRARQAVRGKDEFLAMLSHELRTPLTPSLMMLGALAEEEELENGLRKDLEMVRRNVEHEARLIDDLLDVTRVANGKLALSPGHVNLHELLAELLETNGGELRTKGIVARSVLDAQRVWIYGDRARLQQVFWNLLKNGIKFTPSGGRIEIQTSDAGEKVRVDVIDTGAGIEASVLPKIFQRFEQGGNAVTQEYGGLGLGLSICRAIVDLHRGAIRAESRGPGWGATFTVVLPAQKTGPSTVKVQTQKLRLNGVLPRRVLLVDDHGDTRETLTRLLTRSKYEVTAASSVAEALQKAEQGQFDILVSDIGLPDGSGLELMKTLRERGLRGVALSGYGTGEDVEKSLAAGFAVHLTKPVDFQKLKLAMGEALRPRDDAAAA